MADAIEASALDFPDDHEFWGEFTQEPGPRHRQRAVVARLPLRRSRRLGGWTPPVAARPVAGARLRRASTRCASATGRPRKATAELFRDVSVAADEYLAGIAGDLTLAEMVAMLGRRADGLAEVWNHWGTDPAAPARRGLTPGQPGPSSSSSSMTTDPQGLGGGRPDRRALLGRPGPDPVGQALRVVDLAGVRAERLDLALERRRDVDPGVAPVRPEEVDPADLVGRQPAPGEPRERHRVARRRVDRVDRRRSRPLDGRCG